jgi:hypothetical protein
MTKAAFSQLYKNEISTVAKKHKLTNAEVVKIYYTQFKLIQDQMRKDYKLPFEDRSTIKVTGLGTFIYYPKIAKHIQKTYESDLSQIKTSPKDGDGN